MRMLTMILRCSKTVRYIECSLNAVILRLDASCSGCIFDTFDMSAEARMTEEEWMN